MTWARLDDNMLEHPKFAGISDRALRLWLEAVLYSARNLTDGRVPNARAMLPQCRRKLRHDPVKELEQRGLISLRGNGTMIVHDFLAYNPSKQQVQERRQGERERQRRRRSRRDTPRDTPRESRVSHSTPSRPVPEVTEVTSSAGPRKRDPIWDGFAEWLKREPETKTERGKWNAAAKQLREIGVDSSEDVAARGRRYEQAYPGIVPTPLGLVGHWSELNGSPPTEQRSDPDWMFRFMGEGPDVR